MRNSSIGVGTRDRSDKTWKHQVYEYKEAVSTQNPAKSVMQSTGPWTTNRRW